MSVVQKVKLNVKQYVNNEHNRALSGIESKINSKLNSNSALLRFDGRGDKLALDIYKDSKLGKALSGK